MQVKFHVHSPGELAAGIRPLDETITITLEYTRESDLDLPDFIEHTRQYLKDWFDTPSVYTESEFRAIMAQQNALEPIQGQD